jgi:protein-tyrosine phosphatase
LNRNGQTEMKQVIFLCSANYYRSRFAEHFFNWLASQEGLDWRADSRGLLVGHWGDIGCISRYTVEALETRGIPMDGEHRLPKPLTLADLGSAELVVAVKEAEHRPLMAEQFPLWRDRVEYWHVDDLDCATSDEALPVLEDCVRRLVERLRCSNRCGEAA